jgi:hypothetical protein
MKFIQILLLISFFTLYSCATKKVTIFPPPVLSMGYPEFVNFCDIQNHKKEIVYTRFIYTGVDEYWGISAPDKKCVEWANLEIPEKVEFTEKFTKSFKQVHESYWNTYLIIDAIGAFDNSNSNGYGHLGMNKTNFKVEKIIDIQVIFKNQ